MNVHRLYFTPEPRRNLSGCEWAADQNGYLGNAPKRQSQRFISFLPGTESKSIRLKKIFPRRAQSSHLFLRLKILRGGRCKPQQAATSGHTVNTHYKRGALYDACLQIQSTWP